MKRADSNRKFHFVMLIILLHQLCNCVYNTCFNFDYMSNARRIEYKEQRCYVRHIENITTTGNIL